MRKNDFWPNFYAWCICFLVGCIVILFISFLSSCCTPKVVPPQIIIKDSIVTVIKERVIRDTVTFYVPVEVHNNVTADDSSHLETSFAKSDAWVKDGFLHHSLENKPQGIDVPHDVVVTDTTTTHSSETTITPPPEPVYIEKELSWWQKVCIKYFPWVLGGFLLCIVWIFRKPIKILVSKF